MRFKLYTRANDGSDDPVITIGGIIPRIVANDDAEAIATAHTLIEGHDDRTRIGSWEIVEIDLHDVCIRNVFEEAMKHPLIRFRVDAKFSDVGVAYIEAISQEEAEKKADNLDGGEFLVDSLATTGDAEIISVVALDDPCCPEGTGECDAYHDAEGQHVQAPRDDKEEATE